MTALAMNLPPDPQPIPIWRRYWPIMFMALLPLIPLYRAVFMGEAIGPFNQIRQMAPWNGPKPVQPWDVLQIDGVLQFYTWRDLVFDAWGKGQLPFWNPYQLAGTPLLGNSQSAALYPPHILMGILHVPTATAMTLLAWFHLFWAGLGTYMFCMALGAKKIGAFVGGASFALSTFMIAWTGLPSVIETVSWIPWALAVLLMVFDENPILVNFRSAPALDKPIEPMQIAARMKAAKGRYTLLTLGLAFCLAMMLLCGHLQFVAYGFLAIGLLFVWLVATRRNPLKAPGFEVARASVSSSDAPVSEHVVSAAVTLGNPVLGSAIRVVLAGILGICIAAPQLFAVLQYSQFSHRKNAPTAGGYEKYVDGAIQPYELIKLVIPSFQGNPRQMASDQLPISTYYPAILKLGANFAESAIGIGVFALMLLCFLPLVSKLREPVWGAMLFGAVGFLLALGTPINRLLYFGVPGWSSTGSPGRAICLFVLAASVGAGIAASRLDQLKELIARRSPRFIVGVTAFTIVVVVCGMLKNGYSLRTGLSQELVDGLKTQAEAGAFSSGIGISLLGIMAVALASWETSLRSKALLVSVPILGCLAFYGTSLVQTGQPNLSVKNQMGMERIAPINKAWSFFQAPNAILPPNLSALNRIHSLDGYDSLLHRDTVALLGSIDGGDAAPPENGNMMFIKPKADWKKLADAGVTEVWSAEPIPELGESIAEGKILKYRLASPGRASTPQGKAEIVEESYSKLKLQAVGPGKLVVRDRNMPGWLPKVDGAHAALGGTTWMEIDLPTGRHQVELNYVPPGFMAGVLLAIPAWILVFSLAFWAGVLALRGRTAS
jgi:hypothetical protein